jgi:hypothetical protein
MQPADDATGGPTTQTVTVEGFDLHVCVDSVASLRVLRGQVLVRSGS